MRRAATIMALTAGLIGISQSALALETIPSAGPVPSPAAQNAGDGGLIAYAWDPTTSVSLVVWLGRTINNSQLADLAPAAGLTLDYGVLPQFGTVFQLSQSSNIHWGVVAADNQLNSGSTTLGRNVAVTGFADGSMTQTSAGVPTIATAVQNMIEGFMNTSTQCSPLNGNPCVSGDFDGAGGPLPLVNGTAFVGSVWGSAPLLLGNASQTVGNALGFYNFGSNGPVGSAIKTIYQNASGLGQWLLNSDGHLTYTIAGPGSVPLPAAVWLLMSGLAGIATIGRRRKVA